MYDVNVKKINDILIQMETLSDTMREIKDSGKESFQTEPIRYFAGQRVMQLAIESVTDVGSLLIDGFIMRDPGSYQDIIEIMIDEKVVSADEGQALIQMVSHRKILTQGYMELESGPLFQWISDHVDDVNHFPDKIRTYLERELSFL
jgi:uncharacterized protein YutE (UPF0331/DUF86 family)